MGQLLGPDFPTEIGLAVSGGGDSMAMLALAHNWTRSYGIALRVVTVDHGLRADSAQEAAMVARECATLGWPHETLRWDGWDGSGNLQDAGRRARLALIDGWRGDMRDVLFAHTQDDQAETLLMRLRRGSGVEGLSGMSASRDLGGMRILRPLLAERRADLRFYLKVLKMPWIEDPSNEDPRFDRVKMRRLLAVLEADGIGAAELVATAHRMARARGALEARARDVARQIAQVWQGDLLLDRDGLSAIERDTQLRLLAAALGWVSSSEYRPRANALEALLERCLAGGGGTLQGCDVRAEKTVIRVSREYAAIAGLAVPLGAVWDARWRLSGPDRPGLTVRALGEDGLLQLQDRPEGTAPRRACLSLPAVFDGTHLVACPALGLYAGYTAALSPQGGPFVTSLFAH